MRVHFSRRVRSDASDGAGLQAARTARSVLDPGFLQSLEHLGILLSDEVGQRREDAIDLQRHQQRSEDADEELVRAVLGPLARLAHPASNAAGRAAPASAPRRRLRASTLESSTQRQDD
eukprot:CAMPEP_0175181936 /NCGR_PEP_ID=MMETSP0093-20121207/46_1 /TAXON_ID=311494 /ORGANISM="Alexandrium monilatum, Strain CCMP3105" /LENGTH=118 /DNA_ID=CAMNT_0016474469 /DNA_START=34 /DNA_END=387 /DNA_ORIENTATION=-